MKKLVYAVAALLLMILNGCEYNPLYDGQAFCVYDKTCGMLDRDGGHVYVTLQSEEPYVLECYGGKGRKCSVSIADPEYLDCSMEKSDVQLPPFDGVDLIPYSVTLLPKKLGDTSIVVKDEHTGESVQIYVHICNAYKALEISQGGSVFETGTLLALTYGGVDDVVRICRGTVAERNIEHVADGKYRFLEIDEALYFEMTFPADDQGRPSKEGTESVRRFQVQFYEGGTERAWYMLRLMNLDEFPVETRKVENIETYYVDFRFMDVTGVESPENGYDDGEFFMTSSTVLLPWIF